jgi:hypothetical protein
MPKKVLSAIAFAPLTTRLLLCAVLAEDCR